MYTFVVCASPSRIGALAIGDKGGVEGRGNGGSDLVVGVIGEGAVEVVVVVSNVLDEEIGVSGEIATEGGVGEVLMSSVREGGGMTGGRR